VAQDALFQRQIAETLGSIDPQRGLLQAATQFTSNYGLLVLLLLPAVGGLSRSSVRVKWAMAVTVSLFVLSAYQERWGDFLAVALVMTCGAVVQARWGERPWMCVGLILLATAPQWWQAVEVRAEARRHGPGARGWYETVLVMDELSACLERAGEPPVVLADWVQSGFLAGTGKVRVVGSGYWSNLQGLKDSHELFSTSSEQRFWELVAERRIEYFFRSPSPVLREAIRNSFRVSGRDTPTLKQIEETVIWRIASSDDWPAVACPRIARVAPACSVLRLDRAALRDAQR
jgi:hypothetical protein